MPAAAPGPQQTGVPRSRLGEEALAISNAVVKLLREHAGRGPTKAKTTITSDLVVVSLRECLTVAEKTLSESGRMDLVEQGRDALHGAIRVDACAAVEAITGCGVIAYLSNQQVAPDYAIIAFVLDRPYDGYLREAA